MNSILGKALKAVSQKWQVVLIMYLTGLILVALPLWKFYAILQGEAGHSMALNELVPDFRYMIFSDFMRQSGKAFRPVLAYGALFGFLGSLIYSFLSGGAIGQWMNHGQRFSLRAFLQDASRLFWKYLLLLILLGILLFVFFLVCGIFYFIFVLLAEGSSERGYVLWLLPPTFLLGYLMSFGLVLGFYAKVMLYLERNLKTIDAFWKAFSYVYHRQQTVFLFWLISICGLVLSMLYLQIDKHLGMISPITIWIMLLVQQLTVFLRFFIKNWNYATAVHYFKQHPVKLLEAPPPALETVFRKEQENENSANDEEE